MAYLYILAVILFSGLPFAVAATDGAPSLSMPLACNFGVDCFIQNYVDKDADAHYSDYHCGFLSYDGHRGTDFRPKSINAITAGVPVLAAADGKVRAIRDGMDDISVRVLGKQALQGKDAGNSVVIVHGSDWETQYAHMKKGSIAVHAGQIVTRGTVLGQVGLSGNTEFPHMHFEVRYRGKAVDPFVGVSGGEACSLGKKPLWSEDAVRKIAYIPSEVLAAGFTDHQLAAGEEVAENMTLGVDAPVLGFWLTTFGVQGEDAQLVDLFAPDGKLLLHQALPIDHNMAQYRLFVGLKRRGNAWPTGEYRVNYQLMRRHQAKPVLTRQFNLRIF